MVATEFCFVQEAGNEESTLLHEYEEEEEETLSLSDLPINNNSNLESLSSVQWVDFSKKDGLNVDGDDDDFFEFFSEEFTTSTTSTAENYIVFCGKLIPFKDHPYTPSHMNQESNNIQKGTEKPTSKKGQETCEYSLTRSTSTTTTRSRWFLFMFGMSRLSNNEIKLTDIRNRQSRSRSRRSLSAGMFPVPENGEKVKVNGRRRYRGGVWRMLKSISVGLGCSSSRIANDVVKAAFV